MRIVIILILFLSSLLPKAQNTPIINEASNANGITILDEDGDNNDWIEIYNPGNSPIQLNQFFLSDDADIPQMWKFPDLWLNAHSYLLIFASGKDRSTPINHWETAVRGDSLWHYKNPSEESTYDYLNWTNTDYNDSEWESGFGAFGNGYNRIQTITSDQLRSIYLRKEFYISDTSKILATFLHAYYDDGFTFYLNGYEIKRVNMIEDGFKPSYNKTAFSIHNSKIDTENPPESFFIEPYLWKNLLKNGKNVLAVQNHNFWNTFPIVIKPWLSFAMSDSIYQFDTISPLLPVQSLPLHSNFKINRQGEKIYLADSLGVILQSLEIPELPINTSIGLHPQFQDSLVFYKTPTPGKVNANSAASGLISDTVQLIIPTGRYQDSVLIEVLNPLSHFQIRYSIDGNLPMDTSSIYESPFYSDTSIVVRFRYFSDSLLSGPVTDASYFINDSSTLEIYSLITDPYNLWDDEYGIYTLGTHHLEAPYYFGANFWQDWERPIHIQQLNKQGELIWEQDAGIKIHGNYTRIIPQKSLGFYAKSEYGNSRFEQQNFSEKPFMANVKRFLLRNAGNDNQQAHFRDLLIQRRMAQQNLDVQSGNTVLAYLNGQYWGIYHVREKIDRYYLEDNWGVDPEKVNLLEQNGLIVSGDRNGFELLLNFIKSKDLSQNNNYQYVSNEIEISNWIDNIITNLYHFNFDWPHHNTKFWNAPGRKWRQILVDQDVTLALSPQNGADRNAVAKLHTDSLSYLAIIYKKLIENRDFKIQYSNRFADLMNTIFLPQEYLPIFDSIIEILGPEMFRHSEKWDLTYENWLGYYTGNIRDFIEDRSPYMRDHLRNQYNLGENDTLTLYIEPQGKGKIKLNSIFIESSPWSGIYFDSIPVKFEAIPNPGYEFVRWESPTSPQLADSGRIVNSWFLKSQDTIKAIFYSPTGSEDTLQLAFSELNYRAYDKAEAGDWIEIYNRESDTIDLSDWVLKTDLPYKYWNIPTGTKIAPASYLVLVQDTNLFKKIHPEISNFVGPFEFGLKTEGENLSLWDEFDRLVSYFSFNKTGDWPNNMGTSKTIELGYMDADYHMAENWQLGCPGGSPGRELHDCQIRIPLKITEINYKSISSYPSGDWVELLNNGNDTLDLSQFIFRDSNLDNEYIFPENTLIPPSEMFILAEDTNAYFSIQPKNKRVFGSFNFGLSASGETLSLSNIFDQKMMELTYTNEAPWPEDASGNGFTIELSDTTLDMKNGSNWISNCFLGTPLNLPSYCVQANSVIISEVKYQSHPDEESGDWIEVFNTNDREIDLKNWKFVHSGDTLNIDSSFLVAPQEYAVIVSDSSLFYRVYSSSIQTIPSGYFDIQKDNDVILVLNPYRHPGNILSYNYLLNWPVFQTDTNNRTLELMNYNNTLLAENWRASCENGTPGTDPSPCVTEGLNSLSSSSYQLEVHPNPTTDLLNLEFQLNVAENMEIKIRDMQSQLVFQQYTGLLSSGSHIINLHLLRLKSGIYFLELRGKEGLAEKKIIKLK